MIDLPLIAQAKKHQDRIALVTEKSSFTYDDLLEKSAQIATYLLQDSYDLQEQRIAFIVPASFDYVAIQWGIWRAGAIAVPLCISYPRPELEYVIADTDAAIIIAHPDYAEILRPIAEEKGCHFYLTSDFNRIQSRELPSVDPVRRALILYTSGTTGKPKGVVLTHQNIQAQVMSLVTAWGWTYDDKILHILPLHHIHGIVNVLTCALWVGGTCYFLPKFNAEQVWDYFITQKLTLFMAVPTIYVRLITAWEKATPEQQEIMTQACLKMRLMVSGSAALPVPVLQQWQKISGHFLLERYGMTEIGMALSNPLEGDRLAGFVGKPLPNVEVRLVDETGNPVSEGIAGEIQVKSPNIFLEYWQKPAATAQVFQEGWFRTGDLAIVENGNYRILGRLSVDILKTGGYKVSALEIEAELRHHPDILDCAVVGIPDPEWGDRLCAALILRQNSDLSLEMLRSWAKERLAVYKIPSRIQIVAELPHNAMGKITKPAVAKLFEIGDRPTSIP